MNHSVTRRLDVARPQRLALGAACLVILAGFAFAPSHAAGPAPTPATPAATPAASPAATPSAAGAPATRPDAEGEVRRIDKAQGKVTLRHGRIPSLDMAPMTMVFRVADPGMLDRLQPGAKVKFAAQSVNGALTVVAIEPAE